MTRRFPRRLLWVCVATAAARAAPCAAQVDASLDAGTSYVKYAGYLGSGAFEITPAVGWRSARTALGAHATFVAFESGNTSIQGLFSASTFTGSAGPLRVEAAGEAGASAYAGFARFAHALGRVRVHALGHGAGVWAGALAGTLSRGGGVQAAWGGTGGAWLRTGAGAAEVSWTRVAVGDTAYTDLEGHARWRRGALDLEVSGGTRLASRSAGHGVFGDVSAALRLRETLALVAAAGLYPSDPVRGSIPGRYATLGLRYTPRAAPRTAWVSQVGPAVDPPARGDPAAGPVAAARVALEQVDGVALLVVRVDGDRRVEVMGDFTDWQPVVLGAAGSGRYRYAVALPPGVHRFNLRVDGGAWGVPGGAGFARDEFGGSVGVLVVP